MQSGAKLVQNYRRLTAANLALVAVVCVVAAMLAYRSSREAAEDDLRAVARETLAVQSETLNGMLEKYRLLPALMSRRQDLPEVFATDTLETRQRAHDIAREVAGLSGALDVLFIKPNGDVLASGIGLFTEDIAPASPLMSAALQGRLGREVKTLGNGQRAYVFASGVSSNNRIVGVLAVYVDLENFEFTWSLTNNPVLAVNAAGLIIMANQPQWRMKPLADIREQKGELVTYQTGDSQAEYLELFRRLPLLDWRLGVLIDTEPLHQAGMSWATIAVLSTSILGILMQLLINDRFQTRRRERQTRANALWLERRVRNRTSELLQSNTALQNEIAERKHAEEQLRTAQDELVQTGKLAALGQMSTALSHEYNQPLTAIKSYAANALTYLKLGRDEAAKGNIEHISTLTDRMADISRHLRNFARRPDSTIGNVALKPVIDDALLVLAARLKKEKAELSIDIPPDLYVQAGHVRLQQVIINLVVNALDAMADQNLRHIAIRATADRDNVKLSVTDTGPGIAPEVLETLFDPFVSTKKAGQGLGLGLSISFNIIKDFGGHLSAQNSANGGAEFIIALKRGEKDKDAAQ